MLTITVQEAENAHECVKDLMRQVKDQVKHRPVAESILGRLRDLMEFVVAAQRLAAERDELLEAAKEMLDAFDNATESDEWSTTELRTAIAKAETAPAAASRCPYPSSHHPSCDCEGEGGGR